MNPNKIHYEFFKELEARVSSGCITQAEADAAMKRIAEKWNGTRLLIEVDNALEIGAYVEGEV